MGITWINRLVVFFKDKVIFPFLVAAGLLTGDFVSAQNAYTLKKVDLPAPFKYNEIRNIITDDDGFLWFTNNQGLWRYDGTDVQQFDAHDKQLAKSTLPDVLYAYDGYILMFFNNTKGCLMYAYDTHKSTANKFTIAEIPINFFPAPGGKLVFYTRNGQMWQFSRHSLLIKGENIQQVSGWRHHQKIYNFKADTDGSTYLFYGDKIAKLNNKRIYFGPDTAGTIDFAKDYFTYPIDILFSPTRILARFSNGFIIYDKYTLKKVYEYKNTDVQFALTFKDRFIIFYAGNSQMQAIDKLFDVQRSPFNGLANSVKYISPEPGSNRVLVATDKGLFELAPAAAANPDNKGIELPAGFFKNKSVRSIYRLKDGRLYVGTYQGFFVIGHNNVRLIDKTVVYCINRVDDNTLILGTEGNTGFATLDLNSNRYQAINNAAPTFGFSVVKDNDGYIAGTGYDLCRIKKTADGEWHVSRILRSDSMGLVKQITKVNKEWWVAGSKGLFRLNSNNTLKRIFPLNEKYAIYTFLQEGNTVWLGTAANGLVKIDLNGNVLQHLGFSNGLAGDFVYSLYKTNGLLYAGTNGGLSVFDTYAGMQPIPAPDDAQYSEELNHSAIFFDKYRQQLLLGGVQGLLIPDMAYYASAKSKTADLIKLSYVKKGSNGVLPEETNLFAYLQKDIVLNPGDVFMGLKFASSNIWQQGKFLFRIRQLDTTWRTAKLSDEISFYALAPGAYSLQARFPSASSPHYWLTKTIIVMPHFYQTWLFKLLMVLLTAAIIYAVWLYRLRKIRSEQLMRTTIASDLHDEIGSALTRISLSSELMNMKKPDKELERISNDSKTAIASISDIIWSVDARNDNIDDLILRMKEHTYNMLDDAADVSFETIGLDKQLDLPQLVRQNLYLIFKEAINNIVRHNENPKVWIELNNQLTGMTITIKNTISLKNSKPAFVGQGLKNIKMRAKRMKADAEISHADGVFVIVLRMKRW